MLGLCRMLPEFWLGAGTCVFPSGCPFRVCGIHYLHFGIILFLCTSVLVLVVSYCSQPIEDQHVREFDQRCTDSPGHDLEPDVFCCVFVLLASPSSVQPAAFQRGEEGFGPGGGREESLRRGLVVRWKTLPDARSSTGGTREPAGHQRGRRVEVRCEC